jgi:putative membrane protein
MVGMLIRIVATAVAFAILAYVLPQVAFEGGIEELLLLAIVFGVVNGFIRPVVKLLSLPITAMTLGLFGLVVNGLLLLLVAWIAGQLNIDFTVGGFPPDLGLDAIIGAIIASIVLGIINGILGLVFPD